MDRQAGGQHPGRVTANGCPRSTSQHHRPAETEHQRHGQMNKLTHFNASSHTLATVTNQYSWGLFWQDKG